MLTDETINNEWRKANKQDDSWMPHIHARFARAIESAATAPLLAEIERLKAERERNLESIRTNNTLHEKYLARIAELESPQSTLSWGGFNLHGDIRSIVEANRLLHEANTVPELKARIAAAQASNAQAEPLVLERLSEEEIIGCVKQSELGNGIFWPSGTNEFVNSIQDAIAAKNGAKLK